MWCNLPLSNIPVMIANCTLIQCNVYTHCRTTYMYKPSHELRLVCR